MPATTTDDGTGPARQGSLYSGLPNKLASAANGVDYAYRDTAPGASGVPLVLFQHFRGNLDNWDPALIDALAPARRVITFDNAGVGGSTGATPGTVEPRVLHRQLHRPAGRADQAGRRTAAGTRVRRAAGRRRHARLGP